MLTSTNRGGIRDSLKQWSNRKNIPDDVLNDFIEIALSKANRALRVSALEAYITIDVEEGGFVPLPEDYLEAKELTVDINNSTVVLERKPVFIVDEEANSTSGYPWCFSIVGNYIRIAPYNLDSGTVFLYYWKALPSMVDDMDSNWFTQYSGEVLLYGALAELSSYARDSEGAVMWSQKFNEAVNVLQAVEDRAMLSGSTLRISNR